MKVRKYEEQGKMKKNKLNKLWERLKVERKKDIGIKEMRIERREKRIVIGSLIKKEERERFEKEFGDEIEEERS